MAYVRSQDKDVTSWVSNSGLFDPKFHTLDLGSSATGIWARHVYTIYDVPEMAAQEPHSAQIETSHHFSPSPQTSTSTGCIFALCAPYRGPVEWHSMNPALWLSAASLLQLPQGNVRQYQIAKPGWANLGSALYLQRDREDLEGLNPRPSPISSCFMSVNPHSVLAFRNGLQGKWWDIVRY